MIIRKKIDLDAPLTKAQKQMLDKAEKRPICFDEDCPELSSQQIEQMIIAAKKRRFGAAD